MINLENVSQPYGLSNVSCHIPQGKLVGIMGANGAGKSTLLKSLAGILPLASGQIWLNGRKLSEMSAQQKSEQLAYLAQNTAIHWDLSTYEVIALGLPYPLSPAKEQEKVRSISARFSVSALLDKPFQQLSGGEKARVQLARCCIKNAPLLLADEPIAPLDPYYQIDMMEQLKSLTPKQTCVVAIHHLSLAYKFCDEVILLDKGNVLACGETQAVLNAENLAKAFGVRAEFDLAQKEILGVEKLES
ncbi:ABC transporter ATP-binding protein [Rodentibacter pneumotropicus]|uniref:Hemin import ATP-binding protein HmuV n=1 Tax=Rodentibacter pneumotropicus TaxID=758 RepID=A0A3S4TXG4_9PAST|nr:ABC transporter ATP-binding protein [Rodentibacter pneumotropicus]MDC2825546.1 ABC transporter ATP-binding protein [Rodentibacter pneumotropicus]NBH75147.1 ABC transporter ATP-binding protein [Rodentibacter pneumotropicus]OOF60714.1 heme ABC transporter [Rodentibacter pneumotropicus]TGZ98845.1 ABC transporter ATP-binding protein [Rodentibacter pneumotropicus]THA05138.1 ABC transporter ATP-binding protein [Rodentibacter pneumotropicus]